MADLGEAGWFGGPASFLDEKEEQPLDGTMGDRETT